MEELSLSSLCLRYPPLLIIHNFTITLSIPQVYLENECSCCLVMFSKRAKGEERGVGKTV